MSDQPVGVPAVAGPVVRPRRLRTTPALRRMVAETRVEARHLVLPLFVREGIEEPLPVSSMPGVVQHTRSSLVKAAHDAALLVVGSGRKSLVARALLGSVSEYCVRHSRVPVVVVPDPARLGEDAVVHEEIVPADS